MRQLKNFIGGEWRESKGKRVKDVNPADTSEVVAEAPSSSAAEAAEAVSYTHLTLPTTPYV